MITKKNYPVSQARANQSLFNNNSYLSEYAKSINDADAFWNEKGKILEWFKPYTKVKNSSFEPGNISIKWFEDGQLNVSVNCLDRHLEKYGDKIAILWEGDEIGEEQRITYKELHARVCQFANALRAQGIKKGDVVCLYMPMIPEAAIAMLACSRIGAVHSVIFAGFSAEAIASRVIDSQTKLLITADQARRGGRVLNLKENVDKALQKEKTECVKKVIVFKNTGAKINWENHRDLDWDNICHPQLTHCEPEIMASEDPLFILYTSGSTGTPKGVLHTTGGYLVYVALTFKYVFDYQEDDIYWCSADVGWITGHSYTIYGALANGATTLLFEGVPNYPTPARMSQIIDKYQVTLLYTAPTVIRALMAAGQKATEGTSRKSLRILGSVGEPINPEAWLWYYNEMGNRSCPIVDTWWQTETGGILITPLPGATDLKPGSATRPFFGIQPALVDKEGKILKGEGEGSLVILESWPGQMRTLFNNHKHFENTYFSKYKGMYFTGDGARRDKDGYYWITGRIDDVLNVSGHRMGTAEIESALLTHPNVIEAAVVGIPHDKKGQCIYAYIALTPNTLNDNNLQTEIKQCVREELGSLAIPEILHCTQDLPKTRSGKIMRRILRKIANGDGYQLGDTSTLANQSVVYRLLEEHKIISK
ncbi:acetate--CoA ligase [Psychromonas sp. CD1]|uniref:acetate--CoA ligase n=1 Tax=Psychromonas sp. CD1 TaxID=1979839 RepID=UPI000B9C2491|nr:acetate--CoA ligase [Psychromonas sp. CD1]